MKKNVYCLCSFLIVLLINSNSYASCEESVPLVLENKDIIRSLENLTTTAQNAISIIKEKADPAQYQSLLEFLELIMTSLEVAENQENENNTPITRNAFKPTILKNLLVLNNASVKGNFDAGKSHKTFCYDATTGRIGIGTKNPQTKLDVHGTTHIKKNLVVDNNVTISQMDSGVVCSQNGKLIVAQIKNGELADNSVGTFELLDRCVTPDKIAQHSITPDQLQNPLDGDLALTGNLVFNTTYNAIGSDAESLLKIMRGTVQSNGTILSGNGFSVNSPSTGVYDITFDTAFGGVNDYLVIATPSTSINRRIRVSNTSATEVTIETFNDAGTPTAQQFSFLAIGV